MMKKRENLGREFIDEAYAAFDIIADRAESFPVVHKDIRRALMKRFPYAIYFRQEMDAVIIFVVIPPLGHHESGSVDCDSCLDVSSGLRFSP